MVNHAQRPGLWLAATLAVLTASWACSSSAPVHPRMSDKTEAATSDEEGEEDEDVSDTEEPGVEGGDEKKKQQKPSFSALTHLQAFESTTHPLLIQWCGSCHATAQPPLFALPEAAKAFDALMSSGKIDLKEPARSRIYLRIASENHNCPAEGCEASAKKLAQAFEQWASSVDASGEQIAGPKLPTTVPHLLSKAVSTHTDSGLPAGVLLLEAEKGTLKAPMVALAVDGAGGGMVVHTPAGAGSQLNLQTAERDANLGTITFDFDVTAAGSYRVIGRVNAPTTGNSSFYLKVDGGNLLLWDFPQSGANYVFDTADAAAAAGAPHLLTLTAGKHTIEIRQREEQTKLDSLILTTDATLDPTSVKASPREFKVLSYDLSEISKVQGAKLLVDVADYSANAYLLKSPRIELGSGTLKVKGLKLLINDVYLPQHATFMAVDTTVRTPGAALSTAALVALKDKGADKDQFSFSFETLEAAP